MQINAFVVSKTDQPGRVLAVFVIAPTLAKKGIDYNDIFITVFSITLFTWDLFWLIAKPPRTIK